MHVIGGLEIGTPEGYSDHKMAGLDRLTESCLEDYERVKKSEENSALLSFDLNQSPLLQIGDRTKYYRTGFEHAL
jgi:hypothetical protein